MKNITLTCKWKPNLSKKKILLHPKSLRREKNFGVKLTLHLSK
jgi:hypothetical protein